MFQSHSAHSARPLAPAFLLRFPRDSFYFGSIACGENDSYGHSLDVHIHDWSIKGVNGLDHLAASMANYVLRVDLRGLKPPTLHNGNGLITYGLGGFSYYYSRARMSLSGIVVDHNQPLQVSGEAWMDHQWGNFLSLGGGGWDWFSIQLSNNTEIKLVLIRDADGNTN